MESSHSWKDNRSLASQEIPRFAIRRFSTAFTRARHLSPSWDRSVQSVPPSSFLNIEVNIILPSTPRSSKWSVSLSYPHQQPCRHLPSPPCEFHTSPIYLSQFYYPSTVWWGGQIMNFLSNMLLPRPSEAQISSSASYFRTPSVYVPS